MENESQIFKKYSERKVIPLDLFFKVKNIDCMNINIRKLFLMNNSKPDRKNVLLQCFSSGNSIVYT